MSAALLLAALGGGRAGAQSVDVWKYTSGSGGHWLAIDRAGRLVVFRSTTSDGGATYMTTALRAHVGEVFDEVMSASGFASSPRFVAAGTEPAFVTSGVAYGTESRVWPGGATANPVSSVFGRSRLRVHPVTNEPTLLDTPDPRFVLVDYTFDQSGGVHYLLYELVPNSLTVRVHYGFAPSIGGTLTTKQVDAFGGGVANDGSISVQAGKSPPKISMLYGQGNIRMSLVLLESTGGVTWARTVVAAYPWFSKLTEASVATNADGETIVVYPDVASPYLFAWHAGELRRLTGAPRSEYDGYTLSAYPFVGPETPPAVAQTMHLVAGGVVASVRPALKIQGTVKLALQTASGVRSDLAMRGIQVDVFDRDGKCVKRLNADLSRSTKCDPASGAPPRTSADPVATDADGKYEFLLDPDAARNEPLYVRVTFDILDGDLRREQYVKIYFDRAIDILGGGAPAPNPDTRPWLLKPVPTKRVVDFTMGQLVGDGSCKLSQAGIYTTSANPELGTYTTSASLGTKTQHLCSLALGYSALHDSLVKLPQLLPSSLGAIAASGVGRGVYAPEVYFDPYPSKETFPASFQPERGCSASGTSPGPGRVRIGYLLTKIEKSSSREARDDMFLHETAHHWMNQGFGCTPFAPGDKPHGGYNNPSSTDSWVEGFADFFPVLVRQRLMPRPGWQGSGLYHADHLAAWRLGAWPPLGAYAMEQVRVGGPEELRVAQLLHKLVDARDAPGSTVNLSLPSLAPFYCIEGGNPFHQDFPLPSSWCGARADRFAFDPYQIAEDTLLGWLLTARYADLDNGALVNLRSPADLFSLYQVLKKNLGPIDLDQYVAGHGFFRDGPPGQANGLWEAGEVVGRAANDGTWPPQVPTGPAPPTNQPNRRSLTLPDVFRAAYTFSVNGQPRVATVASLQVQYDPPFEALSYTLESPIPPDRFFLALPERNYSARAIVRVGLSDPDTGSASLWSLPWVLSNQAFWDAIAQAPAGATELAHHHFQYAPFGTNLPPVVPSAQPITSQIIGSLQGGTLIELTAHFDGPAGIVPGPCPGPFVGSGTALNFNHNCLASYRFQALAGQAYTISTCDHFSGDPYLSVAGSCRCFNDNACGPGSRCSCTADSSATVSICASTGAFATSSWAYTITGTCGVPGTMPVQGPSYTWTGTGIRFEDTASGTVRAVFPPGDSIVSVYVCNDVGICNSASTVISTPLAPADSTPPTIQCPGRVEVPGTGPEGAVVLLPRPTATDETDPSPTVVCDRQSGEGFAYGSTNILCRAADAAGNQASCSFEVFVIDTPPSIVLLGPSSLRLECGDAYVEPGAMATDIRDGDLTRSIVVLGEVRPRLLGEQAIQYRVTDSSGNVAVATRLVEVVDTEAPVLEIGASPGLLWPPNHKLVPVHVSANASDRCDPVPRLVLVSVSSSEPDNGLGDGDTASDIQGFVTGIASLEGSLRAERGGGGPGRVYSLRYEASDVSGNSTARVAAVAVPSSQSR